MKKKTNILKEKSNKKRKIITSLLCVSLFCVFSIFLMVTFFDQPSKTNDKTVVDDSSEKENDVEKVDDEVKTNYVVSFNTNGGTDIESIEVTNDDLIDIPEEPYREGYVFDKWLLNGEEYDFDTPIRDNMELEASWIGNTATLGGSNKYTIYYHESSSMIRKNAKPNVVLAKKECTISKYCQITRNGTSKMNGYVFAGWATEPDNDYDKFGWSNWSGTWKYTNGQYGIKNNELHLYEILIKKDTYNIGYYNPNTGIVEYSTCNKNSKCTIRNKCFDKAGYIFKGWTTYSNGNDDRYGWTGWSGTWKYGNGQWGITNNTLILYPRYSVNNNYTISYNPNGGTGSKMLNHACKTGEKCVIKSSTYTRNGYIFKGWTTNRNGQDDRYGWTGWSGTWKYGNGQYGITNNTLTLYAIWEKIPTNVFVINYIANGGNGSMTSNTCKMNSSCAIKSNVFYRNGYEFAGWTTRSDGVDDKYGWTGWSGTWKYSNGQYGINNNSLTLYAMWKRSYILPNDSKFNGYTQVASCNSNTLKYRIINFNGNDFVLIWVNNPATQLYNALAVSDGTRTKDAETILANEVKNNGYQNKCLVATNASFFKMNTGNIEANIIMQKGQVIRNSGRSQGVGITKNGDLVEFVNEPFSTVQNMGIQSSFVHSSSVWPSNTSTRDTTNRTIICQVDKNNFVMVSGTGVPDKLAYDVNNSIAGARCFNLDGGGSRKLYYKTQTSSIIKRFGGSRKIPDMVVFAEQ